MDAAQNQPPLCRSVYKGNTSEYRAYSTWAGRDVLRTGQPTCGDPPIGGVHPLSFAHELSHERADIQMRDLNRKRHSFGRSLRVYAL